MLGLHRSHLRQPCAAPVQSSCPLLPCTLVQKPQENNITASGIILSPLQHKCERIGDENNRLKDAKSKPKLQEVPESSVSTMQRRIN